MTEFRKGDRVEVIALTVSFPWVAKETVITRRVRNGFKVEMEPSWFFKLNENGRDWEHVDRQGNRYHLGRIKR